jgi:hypothetical protein
MESNSDKEMRDKLRGVELPFDPKAWEQMDAMLEKDRKPKAFLWWSMGGIAACLIMAGGIYSSFQFTNPQSAGTTIAAVANKENITNVNAVSNSTPSTLKTSPKEHETHSGLTAATDKKSSTNRVTAKEKNTSLSQPTTKTLAVHETGTQPVALSAETTAEKGTASLKTNNSIASLAAINSSPQASSQKTHKQSNPQAHNKTNKQQTGEPGILAGSAGENPELTNNKSGSLSNGPVTASIAAPPATAADLMLTMKPDGLTTGDEKTEDDLKKKDDDAVDLKKLKKKVAFTYSLGAAANITGSTLGNQGSKNIFDKKPSYMVGVTQDFMFLKRIAITTGFMFSQTSYAVPDFNYTCNITELNIPIGLKAYLVSKSKVRFYLDAGIINHIKLKETFAPINNFNLANTFAQAPYILGSGGAYANSFSSNDRSAAGSYSINQGKRYYASFYTGAGAEFIVKSHLVLFTEPLFYMSLEKVLAPERYKYDLGLCGGFRYQF